MQSSYCAISWRNSVATTTAIASPGTSWRNAAGSRDTLCKARRELLEAGWIILKTRQAASTNSLYAVTFYAIDGCNGKLEV